MPILNFVSSLLGYLGIYDRDKYFHGKFYDIARDSETPGKADPHLVVLTKII